MPVESLQIIFLGTGTSVGVPVIGCQCAVCSSTDPRNNRTRSSILISTPEVKLLIDSGPDLREQALREKISEIDAVIYTHSHLDHVAGFDEMRAFCWKHDSPLPLYATGSTLAVLKNMFGWAFHEDNTYRGYIKPDPQVITSPFHVGDLSVTPLPVLHGNVETIGLLFETTAGTRISYVPDVKIIPEDTLGLMENLDLLIIDALRDVPHATHLSVAEACAISASLSPKKTLLTHLSHDLDHAELAARLPEQISAAYDGMTCAFPA